MLVISRKNGEEVNIGEDIVLKIIDIDKNQVKIGIEAPRDVSILRAELIKEVTLQNKLSTKHVDLEMIQSLKRVIHERKKPRQG